MYRTDSSDSADGDDTADDHTTRRYDGDRTLLRAVVEAVAAETGRDPLELDPLYDAVDSEALQRVVGPDGEGDPPVEQFRFRYEGCDVTVAGDGRVTAVRREREGR